MAISLRYTRGTLIIAKASPSLKLLIYVYLLSVQGANSMRKAGSKLKEDERIELMIRGLLKLPENRRCINCNSLGPQYVCTTFLTFVCTNCSGVHREFTHRVKSISMAKFSAEDVSALQAAGNERARQIYLKNWDPQRNTYPDSSNLNKIRDFINHVYVHRKYAGEKTDQLPRLKLGDKDNFNEPKKVGTYLAEFRSPASRYEQSLSGRSLHRGRSNDRNSGYFIEDRNVDGYSSTTRRSSGYFIEERRSPRYNQENSRFGGRQRESSARFEIVDDRFRDDVTGSRRRSDVHSFTSREHKSGSMSPECQYSTNSSGTVVVRPIKELLGANAPRLEVGKLPKPKAADGMDADDAANYETAPSGSQRCDDWNQVERKKAHSESLVNSNTDPQPSDTAIEAPQIGPITPSDGDKQSSKEAPVKEEVQSAPPPNTLEFLILELGAPLMQSSNDIQSNVSGSDTPAIDALPSNVNNSTTASTSNSQSTGGNIPEVSVSPAARTEQMLMLPSSADTSVTASSTYNMLDQQSGSSNLAGDAAPATVSRQMSTLPNSSSASTNSSTINLLDQPSQDSVPMNSTSTGSAAPNSVDDSRTVSTAIVPVSFFDECPPQDTSDVNVDSTAKVPNAQLENGMQQQPLASSAQNTSTSVAPSNNQPWGSLLVHDQQGPSSASAEQSSLLLTKPAQDTNSRAGSGNLAKSTGRQELPADLFTTSYMPVHAAVPHWQTGHAQPTGFNMQYYPNAMASQLTPAYSNPAKSTNPFDISGGTTPAQLPQFPLMAPLQGALPNVNLMSTPNAAAHYLELRTQSSPSYASSMRQQSSPSFIPDISSSAFMGQQMHTNVIPTSLKGVEGFGGDRSVYVPEPNTPQQPTGGYPVPAATNAFLMGGNPFG